MQIHAVDRIGQHCTESWRLIWIGPEAEAFNTAHNAALCTPGQPLRVQVYGLRSLTTGRWKSGEIHAHVHACALAPRAEQIAEWAAARPATTPHPFPPEMTTGTIPKAGRAVLARTTHPTRYTPNPGALVQLAKDILDPEQFGWAVTAEVRDSARRALGIKTRETAAAQVASYGEPP